MALTLTETASGVMGDQRYWFGTLAFDSSYPTGGEPLAASDLTGFTTSLNAVIVDSGSAVPTKRVVWDSSASTFLIFLENATTGIEAQAGDTSDQSAMVDIQLVVFGY